MPALFTQVMPPATATKKPSVVYGPLVTAAILALKERSGSSVAAIKKWLAANHPEASNESAIKVALKNGVAKASLVKVKASYKVSDAGKKAMKPAKKKAAAKPKAAAKKVRALLLRRPPSAALTRARASAGYQGGAEGVGRQEVPHEGHPQGKEACCGEGQGRG